MSTKRRSLAEIRLDSCWIKEEKVFWLFERRKKEKFWRFSEDYVIVFEWFPRETVKLWRIFDENLSNS